MNTLILTVDDVLLASIAAEAKRRSVSLEQAAADLLALKTYEAEHGPVDPQDLADIDEGLAELARGEHADPAEVAKFFKKHGA